MAAETGSCKRARTDEVCALTGGGATEPLTATTLHHAVAVLYISDVESHGCEAALPGVYLVDDIAQALCADKKTLADLNTDDDTACAAAVVAMAVAIKGPIL